MYNIATGDKTITYTICIIQHLYWCLWSNRISFWLPCPMTVMWPSANPSLSDHHEQQRCQRACPLLLDVQLVDHITTLVLFLNLNSVTHVIDYFFCDASLILKISFLDTWLIEQLVVSLLCWSSFWHMCCSILHLYIKTILRLLSAQPKQKSFFLPVFLIWLWFPSLWPVSSSTSNLQQNNQWLLTRVWQCWHLLLPCWTHSKIYTPEKQNK